MDISLTSEVLIQMTEYLQASEEFVVTQAPLYAQELIAWLRFVWSAALGICMVIFAAGMYLVVLGKRDCESLKDADEGALSKIVGGTAIYVLALLFGIGFAFELARVVIAPRVVILEHLSGLI